MGGGRVCGTEAHCYAHLDIRQRLNPKIELHNIRLNQPDIRELQFNERFVVEPELEILRTRKRVNPRRVKYEATALVVKLD